MAAGPRTLGATPWYGGRLLVSNTSVRIPNFEPK